MADETFGAIPYDERRRQARDLRAAARKIRRELASSIGVSLSDVQRVAGGPQSGYALVVKRQQEG